MAVLDRDKFFERIQAVIGTDTSDESLSFIEDMTDTFNDLENRASADGVDWEQRYKDLDESWKEKYKKRFFSGGTSRVVVDDETDSEDGEKKKISFDDLFEKKEG